MGWGRAEGRGEVKEGGGGLTHTPPVPVPVPVVQPCPLQAEENVQNFTITCSGIGAGDQVSWQVSKDGAVTDAGTCTALMNDTCVSQVPESMTLTRPSEDVSVLTVHSVSRDQHGGAVFTCQTAGGVGQLNSSCVMDVVCK